MFFQKKLTRADIPPHCATCARAQVTDEGLRCAKTQQAVTPEAHCASYRYDPLRRTPPKPARLRGQFTAADFALEDDHETD